MGWKVFTVVNVKIAWLYGMEVKAVFFSYKATDMICIHLLVYSFSKKSFNEQSSPMFALGPKAL